MDSTGSSASDQHPNVHDASSSTLAGNQQSPQSPPVQPKGRRQKWVFHLRSDDDGEPSDWWFCSTAIPLLAATIGPLANVMSIAALVTQWRNDYDPASPGVDAQSQGFPDPKWCLALNGVSLACGFIGNIFLLFNFTRRVRHLWSLFPLGPSDRPQSWESTIPAHIVASHSAIVASSLRSISQSLAALHLEAAALDVTHPYICTTRH